MRYCIIIVTVGLATMASVGDAQARLDIYVDKSSQRIAVVQDGYMRYVWPVSTDRDGYGTPSGVYSPERLERSWSSPEYYNSPMPNAIFFHGGYAIHGSYDITRVGGPASHGCIRLYPQDAALLFAMVEQEGPENTTIVVGGDGQPIPRAPRYRDMDDLVRSAAPAAEGSVALVPPPQPPPNSSMLPLPPRRPRAMPYHDVDRGPPPPPARPDAGYVPPAPKSVYRAPQPRSEPGREVDHGTGAPTRQSADINQPAAASVSRLREPRSGRAPDRDSPSADNAQPVATGLNRPPRNEPNREVDRSPEGQSRPVGDGGAPAAKSASRPPVPRGDTDNAHDAAHGEPANRSSVSATSASQSTQSSLGYKVLPKSYWTGASWRWRANGEPDAQ